LQALDGGKAIKIRIDTIVGMYMVQSAMGEESQYYSEEQFRISKNKTTCRWSIEHIGKAVNPTFLNGTALGAASVDLDEGALISVGPDKGKMVVAFGE
jgi:hypothetical protein